MLCPNCKTEMGKVFGRHQYRECGLDNVWLENWPTFVCSGCSARMPILPDAELAVRCITRVLVCEEPRLDGDSILFLRKAMRLKAANLAYVLGVNRVEVSRWENDKVAIDPYNDFKLRLEAIDRVLPPDERREARDEVVNIMQHAYKRELVVSDEQISVPSELVACAG